MLSKSKYVAGQQCLKRLYLLKKRPDLVPPITESVQARFDAGHKVGDLAQQLFPGGREMVFPTDGNFQPMLKATQEQLAKGAPAIYEAAFSEEGVLVLCDILVKTETGFECYEVKSSTRPKSYHLEDAAIQYFVLKKAGIPVEKVHIMTLNPNYYMEDYEWDLGQLFVSHDVTTEALARQDAIPAKLKEMKSVLRAEEEPQQAIGAHCNDPFACEFKDYCWPKLPSPSVFDIPRIGQRKWSLLEEGKLAFEDLAEENLKPKQWEYVQGQLVEKERFDPKALKEWLDNLSYPLYFLDFETIMPALPLYSQTRPYQPHFAVQYSLHVLEAPEAELKHVEYLANFPHDFRADLANSLLENLGSEGSIIAYNQGFEKACIKRLMDWCPDQYFPLEALLTRFKDLIVPFRKGWYYKPAMQGSNSIKSVYPALLPHNENQYQGLRISNGDEASRTLLALAEGNLNLSSAEYAQIKQDLLAYCELDTLAMVEIYRHLQAEVA